MFQESRSKVQQSHGANHALFPGRSGKNLRTSFSLLVIPALAISAWAGSGSAKPSEAAAQPSAVVAPTTSQHTNDYRRAPLDRESVYYLTVQRRQVAAQAEAALRESAIRYAAAYSQAQAVQWITTVAANQQAADRVRLQAISPQVSPVVRATQPTPPVAVGAPTAPAGADRVWFAAEYARWSKAGWCVIGHESINSGGPVAQNPTSSASGWFQFLDSTWGRFMGFAKARLAPSNVQWWRFFLVWNEGRGVGNWSGDHCG